VSLGNEVASSIPYTRVKLEEQNAKLWKDGSFVCKCTAHRKIANRTSKGMIKKPNLIMRVARYRVAFVAESSLSSGLVL